MKKIRYSFCYFLLLMGAAQDLSAAAKGRRLPTTYPGYKGGNLPLMLLDTRHCHVLENSDITVSRTAFALHCVAWIRFHKEIWQISALQSQNECYAEGILYRGPRIQTPLGSYNLFNSEEVLAFLLKQYAQRGLSKVPSKI